MLNLIWDLDGTLIDSEKEVLYYLNKAVREAGIDANCQIKPFRIGPTIDIIVREAFDSSILTDEMIELVIDRFRKGYDNSDYSLTKPFPNIEDIICDTTQFTHYIVTNKPDMATWRILDILNWRHLFADVVTPYTDGGRDKVPKTQLFGKIISNNGEHTPYMGIGDMRGDCIAARANNITAVGVLWGIGTLEELSDSCDYICKDTQELYNYLYRL